MSYLLVLVACYLLGSIPIGYLAGKAKGVDVRRHGSGNIGMTNVMRVLGATPGLLVLAGDVLKGMVGVWLGQHFGGVQLALLGGLAAIAGHNWSIFLGLRGGRGVATSAGVILALVPPVALTAAVIWAVVVVASRYVSLGSIVASISVPVLMLVFRQPLYYFVFSLALAALIVNQHRPNIKRLRQGTELRIGSRR